MNNTNNASHRVSSFNPSLPSVESLNRALARESRSSGYKPVRLVDTKTLSRDAWLGVRNKGIGSSDAAAAVGLNPYKSSLELWMEKSGKLTQPESCTEGEDNSPLYWGTVLESVVADHYARKTGKRVRRVNAVLQHPSHPWMLANLDRQIVGDNEVQILECKTAGINGAKLWRDGVPEYVQLQVQHQLGVTGYAAADVAVLIGGNDFRVYRIDRDDELITRLIELEADFWHKVEAGIAPDVDGSVSAGNALGYLFPSDTGTVLDWSDKDDVNRVFNQLLLIRGRLSDLEREENQLKQRLQQAMGDASKVVLANGSVSWKASADSLVLDTKRLKEEQPDFYRYYQIPKAGSRRFLVSSAQG